MAKFNSKFKVILDIKQKEADSIELEIVALNHRLTALSNKIASEQADLSSHHAPRLSSIGELVLYKQELSIMRADIARLQGELALLEGEREELYERYRLANIEVEKFTYLYDEELVGYMQTRASKDTRELNEMGNLLFYRRTLRDKD